MGVLHHFRHYHHRHRHRLIPTLTAFALILFAFASAVSLTKFPAGGERRKEGRGLSSLGRFDPVSTEKRVRGPGSAPPTCLSKCGNCSPCKPVRVPIHPGLSSPIEYYPEAWRCKCGNKLFIP